MPLVALGNFYKLNRSLLSFFRLKISATWYSYYCTVTFEDCVHLYDFTIDINAS